MKMMALAVILTIISLILLFVLEALGLIELEDTPPPRRSDPMQALQDPTHPDHVRWTMEILDSDADGVIEDWEMDGSIWD